MSRAFHSGPVWLSCLVVLVTQSGCVRFASDRGTSAVFSARGLTLKGVDAAEKGRWDVAEQFFVQAVESCPEDERSRWRYAHALWQRGALQEAIVHMRSAVQLSGEAPELVIQLGQMYLATGNVEQAAILAERAIESNRQAADAWALRGDVAARQGRLPEALADYHRAIAYQNHDPRLRLAVAEIYLQQQRPHRALATLGRVADEVTSDAGAQALYLAGLACKALERYDDAMDRFQTLAQQKGASVELLYQLGDVRLLAGDPEGAQLALAAALAVAPDHQGCRALQQRLARAQQRLASDPATPRR